MRPETRHGPESAYPERTDPPPSRSLPPAWRAGGLLLAGLLLTLGSSSHHPAPRPRLIPAAPPRRARPAPSPGQAPSRQALPYPACPAPRGILYRDQLAAILSKGAGVFLSGLDVRRVPWSALPDAARAAWAPGKTSPLPGGWRILRFHPGDPCLSRSAARPGDILYSVNGKTIRTPGDLVALWQALRTADRLVIRLVRGATPLVFTVRIAPRPTRASPRP